VSSSLRESSAALQKARRVVDPGFVTGNELCDRITVERRPRLRKD
jgi:hypothetical protein